MSRARTRSVPPGPAGSPLEPRAKAKAKAKRLSRSFRPSPQNRSPDSDFKTPTRICRPRGVGGLSAESPQDCEPQQDIIWDASSPSPRRLGKRGKKHAAGVVDISEIVSRIAPKHGRPKVAEPTLQQWIGDSATIPCTPDVQVPKPKKRSPRPNGVDDLLKLAKQFDFNMFCQDEEAAEDTHQQSLELLPEDILDFENGDPSDVLTSLPGNCAAGVNADAGTDVQVHLDQHMEDDLDFLFDGPTQHVSGNLSQVSAAQLSQLKPAPTPPSKDSSGKSSSHGPVSVASTTNSKDTLEIGEFDDDWDNDDLLNDSLVYEMTQNPQNFVAPKHSSTQKAASEVKYQTPGGVRLDQSAVSKVEKENVRQRMTFKLESNPNFSVKRIQKDKDSKPADQQSRFSSSDSFSVEAGSQHVWQKSEPQKSQFYHRTSAASSVSAASVSNTTVTKTEPAICDFLDEDLDSFFSSDLVWDDPADDNLLCEMCEDLENQVQNMDNVSIKQTLPDIQVSKQRAALQPSNRSWDSRTQQPAPGPGGPLMQPFPQKQTLTTLLCASGGPAGSSLAGGSSDVTAGIQVNTVKDPFRCMQIKTALRSTSSSTCLQGSSRVQPAAAAPRSAAKDQFTFKRPNNPVSTVTNKVVGKCSAAEIELKKQQAMQRRRQRLQAAQNLRAPT